MGSPQVCLLLLSYLDVAARVRRSSSLRFLSRLRWIGSVAISGVGGRMSIWVSCAAVVERRRTVFEEVTIRDRRARDCAAVFAFVT